MHLLRLRLRLFLPLVLFMFKIFRLIETLGRFFKKPPAGTGRRIAMSPFFKNILTEDEEENFKRQEIFYDPHT